MAFEHIFDPLIELDPSERPVPGLAESWEMTDDRTFVFHLRHGVKFHNGREMVADDVVFSVERLINPGKGAASRFGEFPGLVAEAIDQYTVKMTLPAPNAGFILELAAEGSAILPREAVEASGGDLNNPTAENMIGTGPFKFDRYVPNTELSLVRNEEYWREGQPYLDGLLFKYITDESARLAALRAGDIDLAVLRETASSKIVRADSNLVLIERSGTDRALMFLNTQREPFDDMKVRQAMSCALDRQAIIDTVLLGEGAPTPPLPPGDPMAVPVEELTCYTQDIEKSKALLAEAGLPNGFSFKIMATPQYPVTIQFATVVKDQLPKVGINAEIETVEWGNVITRLFAVGRSGDEEATRGAAYRRIQAIMAEDLPRISIMMHGEHMLCRTEYGGYSWSPEVRGSVPFWNCSKVWWSGATRITP